MTITTIILSHYVERQNNLKRMVDDLMDGSIKPEKIIIFIDNPAIQFEDERVIIIRSGTAFLPITRFALGTVCDTDYCFFIDDDLSVKKKTLENLVLHAFQLPQQILGFEGSILSNTETPYSNDKPLKRGVVKFASSVDILIRTYFVPVKSLVAALILRVKYPELPKKSLDDVFLCLGNKFLDKKENYIIPVTEENDLMELPDGGVGQSLTEDHYKNRNEVCRFLMDIYL